MSFAVGFVLALLQTIPLQLQTIALFCVAIRVPFVRTQGKPVSFVSSSRKKNGLFCLCITDILFDGGCAAFISRSVG
jgi:hypothetical protein